MLQTPLTLPSRFRVNRACYRDRWSHSCNAWTPNRRCSLQFLSMMRRENRRCPPEPFIPILRIIPRPSVSHCVPYVVGNPVAEVIGSTVRWLRNGCCRYCHCGHRCCVLRCRCWSVILDHWTLHFADSTASFEVDGCGEAIGVFGVAQSCVRPNCVMCTSLLLCQLAQVCEE